MDLVLLANNVRNQNALRFFKTRIMAKELFILMICLSAQDPLLSYNLGKEKHKVQQTLLSKS